jgi:hypothetical protein
MWALYDTDRPQYEVTFTGADGEPFDLNVEEEEIAEAAASNLKKSRWCEEDLMSLSELLPAVHVLPRPEKLQLMQWLATDLAHEEGIPILQPDGEYPVWSPFDAYEGAATLQAFLQQEKATRAWDDMRSFHILNEIRRSATWAECPICLSSLEPKGWSLRLLPW